jgi:hypothetical protein
MAVLEILLNTQDIFGKFASTWRDVLSQVFCLTDLTVTCMNVLC